MAEKYDFALFVKVWIPMTVSVVVTVVSVMVWGQKYGESHYYSSLEGNALEEKVAEVKTDMAQIRSQNNEILVALGRIEGKLAQ